MGAVSIHNVVTKFYDTIYYHDYHGWRDTKTDCDEVFNAFVAKDSIEIVALSFYTAKDTVNYHLKIYNDYTSGTLQNELTSVSGVMNYTGFHTVDLPQPLRLQKGNDFFIYLQLSKGGQPFDRTSDVPVLLGGGSKTIVNSTAQTGQSYFKNGSAWEDFYNSGPPEWQGTGNFCIKALVKKWGSTGVSEINNNNNLLLKVAPNPSNGKFNISFNLKEAEETDLEIMNVNGSNTTILLNDILPAGKQNLTFNANLPAGVYILKLKTKDSIATNKLIITK
jgi:hypothetical protein